MELGKVSLAIVTIVFCIALPGPTTADGRCDPSSKAGPRWSRQELYVWEQVCKGETADLEARFGGKLPPNDATDWPETRTLRAVFLTALINTMSAREFTWKGVNIRGALVREPLQLSDIKIPSPLALWHSRFEGEIDLSGAYAAAAVSFAGSFFWGPVTMTTFNGSSYLDFNGAILSRGLRLNAARVGGAVFLNEVQADGAIDLRRVVTGGNVELSAAVLQAGLDLQHASVGAALFLSRSESGEKPQFFGPVNAAGIRVGNLISLNEAHFGAGVDLSRATAGNVISMQKSFVTRMLAKNTKVLDGNVDLRGTRFCVLDLSGSQIGMALQLGRPDTHETEGCLGVLRLNGAKVNSIEDIEEGWPAQVELSGLQFSHMSIDGRDSQWLIEKWLARSELCGQYSPQPYEQLAAALRVAGRGDDAASILYASKIKEQERKQGLPWVWSAAQDLLIGFGYRIERSLWYCLGFVIIGALVVSAAARPKLKPAVCVIYSIDSLLPLVKLREDEGTIAVAEWAKYYFYFHRIAGWILASFLVAGLSGLTK